jgi:hypothetical protein
VTLGRRALLKRCRAGAAYALGSLVGALALTAGCGLIGGELPEGVWVATAGAAALWSFSWHARGRDARSVRWARSGRQANKRRARRRFSGRLYFGAILGVGLLTFMATPLVYSIALLAAAVGLPAALMVGAGFGLGRSKPIWLGLRWGGSRDPADVTEHFGVLTWPDHVVGCLTATVIIGGLALVFVV